MRTTLARRALGNLIPPKVATPSSVASGGAATLAPLVAFYSKLPKGPAPAPAVAGIKERFLNGKNASGGPLLFTILGMVGFGYTIDYHMHLKHHKNHAH
ncbi:mitochondrial F1-F0 ATP synthase subunit F of fungi-domain-containing protein [Auriculariales sp. MPI-PUGE-AT-0066]|nr:mitochondrial F1-F0 ATP synthase subunit F of fungi-domain-containing protein [Auriculariales sp. MPI-PUGE-AT-0066]